MTMTGCSSLARILRLVLTCVSVLLLGSAVTPSAAQEPPDGKMRITLSAPNTWTLSVATDSLWEYSIEATDDLDTGWWTPLDSTYLPGDGGVHSQRVIVPQGAIKAFFRYRIQQRANGVSGNALADWDRIYSFNANTFLDTDGDGIPDYLERSFSTNPYDSFSFPWQVVRVDPFNNEAGHPRDGAVVVYLNRPLPASVVTVPANFVRELHHDVWDTLDFANVAPGSVMILPGRKAVAFLPSPSLVAGSNHTYVNNYKIDFSTSVTGIPQLIPSHTEFSTVDTFDDVGPWVKMVRPGETAIEVATDFVPVIDWSQPLHPATVVSGNVSLMDQASGTPVAATVYFDYDTNRMTLQHATPFQPDTAFTVTLGAGFTNLMGKPLLNAFTWTFRTRPLRPVAVAGQGPYVMAVAPGDFSTSVDPWNTYQITMTFSEAMDDSTLTTDTVHLRQHGADTDLSGVFAYDSASKMLTFTPDASLDFATRYDLTLDATAILSSAATPQPLQAQAQFVFTTGQDPFQSGGGSGGMGGPGSGPDGSSGTPDPDQGGPLQLQVSYGDPDLDAGASVRLSLTLPDGSQREQQMPNATNDYATRNSSEFPAGSTVIVIPQFLKGNDPDYEEELSEVQAEVSALNAPAGVSYVMFKGSSSTAWDLLGALIDGPFVAQVAASEKLAAVPVTATINKTAATDDDFVAVSNGTDPDLSTELSIQLGAGVTGTYTADVSMKGTDGDIKFEQTTVTLTPGTPVKVKMWGSSASSAKESSVILIKLKSGTKEAVTEKKVTVIDGVRVTFSGTFYSPVDSRAERWRPSAPNDDATVIAADIADYSSGISFTDGDQAVTFRAWSVRPRVTITKVEAISPSMELTKDPLKGSQVHMTSGAFEHNRAADEKIENPNLVFKSGGSSGQTFFSASVSNPADYTKISTTMGATGGVALTAKITTAATGGNMLAKWLLGQTPWLGNMVPFLQDTLSKASADWQNQKFNAAKGADLAKSIGAKAALGAQEKRGANRIKVQWKMHHYDGWDLSGQVTDAKLETP